MIGVVVGRFQTPYLHEGHLDLLSTAEDENNKLVVLVGCSSTTFTKRNPLDFPTRESMIKNLFPAATILPVFDQPTDEGWSKSLDKMLSDLFPFQKIVLYHGRDSFRISYKGKLETKEINTCTRSATNLREICGSCFGDNEDFRHGVIYASQNSWPRVIPTVDIACWRKSGKSKELLLGRKNPPKGSGKLCLIGGHVDINDENGEIAALRELEEEASIDRNYTHEPKIVTQFFVNDWRHNGNTRILTTLYSIEVPGFVEAKANDDIDEIEWIKFSTLRKKDFQNNIYSNHQNLIISFLDYIERKDI